MCVKLRERTKEKERKEVIVFELNVFTVICEVFLRTRLQTVKYAVAKDLWQHHAGKKK